MRLIFLFFNFLIFLNAAAQKFDTSGTIYLFDSLEDKYLYKIDIIIEKQFSNDSYHLMVGRAQRGFYAFGSNKKVNTLNHDTTRLKYPRLLLEKSQTDSLKKFEQKLIIHNNPNCDTPRQNFILNNQVKNQNYLIKQSPDWNPLDELLLILFRQKG